MRIAYLDCFSGISGDMLLGALVDSGVSLDKLAAVAESLSVGARLEARKVMRGGLAGTKVDVLCGEAGVTAEQAPSAHTHTHEGDSRPHAHAPHRHLSSILKIIAAAPLSDAVKTRATRAFRLLGEAEAAIHSIPIERVHFHEVGAVDTIVDIVCAAAGAEFLGVDRWVASPLNVGSGTVECAHGTLPVPAPATLALIGNAPIYSAGLAMERVTPTGAAILRMLDVQYGPLPAMRPLSSGYGAGGRDTPGQANLLRLIVGDSVQESAEASATEQIAILETVIDDSTPQVLAYVSDLLLQSGAWDVYRIPVQMKKGRSGVQFTVLCHPDRLAALRDILFRETTTIGAHWRIESKMALHREFAHVETQWGLVHIKIARNAEGVVTNASPEYEDCRRIAEQHAIPLKQVMLEAARVYFEQILTARSQSAKTANAAQSELK